jgi:hypothetical protein
MEDDGIYPVIGTVWKGFFSGIPVFGDLFSIKKDPKNVQHQSIVLTNSCIVPTAMGIAHLYNNGTNDVGSNQQTRFYDRCVAVQGYLFEQKNKIYPNQPLNLFAQIRSACGDQPQPQFPPAPLYR